MFLLPGTVLGVNISSGGQPQSSGSEKWVGEVHWLGACFRIIEQPRLSSVQLRAAGEGWAILSAPLWRTWTAGEEEGHSLGAMGSNPGKMLPTASTPPPRPPPTHHSASPCPSLLFRAGRASASHGWLSPLFGGWAWTMVSGKPPPRCPGDIKQAFHRGVLAALVGSWHPPKQRREGPENKCVGGGDGASNSVEACYPPSCETGSRQGHRNNLG